MLAVFAHTGGLTGGEVIVAGDLGRRAEGARGDLRRPSRADAGFAGAGGSARTRRPAPARGGEPVSTPRSTSRPEADSFARLHGAVDAIRRAAQHRSTAWALREAAELADGRLEAADAAARAVVDRATYRLGLESTVVALAGPTGVGKSQLFNVLAGSELAVGRRRPTTASGQAAVWGDGGDALLDWLEISRRHRLDVDGLAGLVLLDLPDFDSIQASHRLAERIVALADLVLWVVEPQKYADASLHDRYLRPLATHAEAMAVVLNQADLLAPADVAAWRSDMEALLSRDGVPKLPLFVVSARSGDGVPSSGRLLTDRAAARDAEAAKLAGDLEQGSRPSPRTVRGRRRDGEDERRLMEALEDAAGVPLCCVPSAMRIAGGARSRPVGPSCAGSSASA